MLIVRTVMNKMRYLIIIISLLILPGCGIMTLFTGGNKPPLQVIDIHTGTEGLKMDFMKDMPLSTYRVAEKGIPIMITLNLENKGAARLGEDTTIAVNTDKSYIILDKYITNIAMEGKTPEHPEEGEKAKLTFSGMIQPLRMEREDTRVDVTACYRYSIEGHYSICIDTDQANLRTGTKACSIDDNGNLGSLSGQGGPVGSNKIEAIFNENLDSITPEFMIHVRNFGEGRIFSTSKTPGELCSSALKDDSSFNVVFVKAYLAGREFICDPNPLIMDPEGDDNYVLCRNAGYTISANTQSFTSSLVIQMEYNYVDSISQPVTLERIKTIN